MSGTQGSKPVCAPISVGELVDKITILEIKQARIADAAKQANVARELAVLSALASEVLHFDDEGLRTVEELRRVNRQLWDVEDEIRDCERRKDFGRLFVELARSVYRHNDFRAQMKNRLNELTGSDLVEEKSYTSYDS